MYSANASTIPNPFKLLPNAYNHFSSEKTTALLAQTLLYVAGYLGCLALGAACAFLYLPLAPSLMPALLLTFQIVDGVAFTALFGMLFYARNEGKYLRASSALLPWAQFAFYITAFASGFGLMPLLLQALMLPNGFALIISAISITAAIFLGAGFYALKTPNYRVSNMFLLSLLIGLLGFGLVAQFTQIPTMMIVYCAVAVVAFSFILFADLVKVFGRAEQLPAGINDQSPMLHFFALDAALDIALDLVNIFVHLLVMFIVLNQEDDSSDLAGKSFMQAACRLVGFMVMVFLPIGLIGYHCMSSKPSEVSQSEEGRGGRGLPSNTFDEKNSSNKQQEQPKGAGTGLLEYYKRKGSGEEPSAPPGYNPYDVGCSYPSAPGGPLF